MNCLIVFLLCLITPLSISKSIQRPPCGSVCDIYCQFGNVADASGCPAYTCKKTPCENNQDSLVGYFCGRGPDRRECPQTHYCHIAPNDAYAVCCPRR